jgi:hypothetical protein
VPVGRVAYPSGGRLDSRLAGWRGELTVFRDERAAVAIEWAWSNSPRKGGSQFVAV